MRIKLINAQRIVKANELERCTLVIEDGVVIELQKQVDFVSAIEDAIDMKAALVTPGLVDVHVHLREPGFTHKETVKTGTQAAARGGFTTICAMPNTKPCPDSSERLEAFNAIVKRDAVVHVYPHAPITRDLSSTMLVDQKVLKQAGAIAFTNDGLGIQDAKTMFEAMKAAAQNNAIIAAHTEDDSLKYEGVLHEGITNQRMNLPGIPSICESSQVARDLILAEASKVHYHVCHVSTKETVRLIADAKRAGIRVSCEVSPHHLLLNELDIQLNDANYKMNPPLRGKDDQEALLRALLDGTIDCIASDHAPHAMDEKKQGMLKAPFGIIGLEYGFALLYTQFVKVGIFSLEQLVDWMSLKPAQIFNLPHESLKLGMKANLAFFDLMTEVTIPDHFVSKSSNSPFKGRSVFGDTVMTIVNGAIVWRKKE